MALFRLGVAVDVTDPDSKQSGRMGMITEINADGDYFCSTPVPLLCPQLAPLSNPAGWVELGLG